MSCLLHFLYVIVKKVEVQFFYNVTWWVFYVRCNAIKIRPNYPISVVLLRRSTKNPKCDKVIIRVRNHLLKIVTCLSIVNAWWSICTVYNLHVTLACDRWISSSFDFHVTLIQALDTSINYLYKFYFNSILFIVACWISDAMILCILHRNVLVFQISWYEF